MKHIKVRIDRTDETVQFVPDLTSTSNGVRLINISKAIPCQHQVSGGECILCSLVIEEELE